MDVSGTGWHKKNFAVSNILSVLLLCCILGGYFYYVYDNRPCAKPLYYSIGTYDSQFGVSESQFLTDAAEAADLWNKEAGHTVLEYKDYGKMPVNLIYDGRQQLTDTGKSISSQQAIIDQQKTAIGLLQSQYDSQKQQIRSDEAAHADVSKINAEIDSLNQLGAQLRADTDALNAQITQVNSQAQSYNTHTGSDFQEGEFIDSGGSMHINIYEFMNHTQLVRVLAHEFGHSLGLGHNSNPDSIMYPENSSTRLVLSADDKSALATRCTFSLQNFNPFSAQSPSSL